MIPNYLGQFPPLAFAEGNEAINNLILFDPTYQTPTLRPNLPNTHISMPYLLYQIQEEEKGDHDRAQQQKQEWVYEQYFLLLSSLGNREQGIGDRARDQTQDIHKQHEGKMQLTSGSSEDHLYRSTSSPASEVCDSSDDHGNGIKHATWKWGDQDNGQCQNGSIERMQIKMKLVKKMINSDGERVNKTMNDVQPRRIHRRDDSYEDNDRNNTPNISIRVCADCNTTKTPLWRSGPRGPKSLCNACGIRQRKARRAMAAVAASGELIVADTPMKCNKMIKAKRSNGEKTRKYKKRCRATDRLHSRKLKFDDFMINLSKKLAFHQMFPQDEKEAAILLMALSCDLICG